MKRLTEVIGGRTVGLILPGASVRQLTTLPLEDMDWCWASLNHFDLIEGNLLEHHGIELDVVLVTSETEIVRRWDDITYFVNRPAENIFVTTCEALRLVMGQIGSRIVYRKTLIVSKPPMQRGPTGALSGPNSASVLLLTLIRAHATRIVVFGMDGCDEPTQTGQKSTYLDGSTFLDGRDTQITRDTWVFNAYFRQQWNLMKKLEEHRCEILNCSPGTLITAIPVVTYDFVRNNLI